MILSKHCSNHNDEKSFALQKMRLLQAIFVLIHAFYVFPAFATSGKLPEEELKILNNTIKSADLYMHEKTAYLDSITRLLGSMPDEKTRERWDLCMILARNYLTMRADSSLKYSDFAIHLCNISDMREELYESRIARINALSTAGIFTQALAEFNDLDKMCKSHEQKILYWLAARKLFGNMRVYVDGEKKFERDYTELFMHYEDSLLMNLPENNDYRTFIYAERLVASGQHEEAKPILSRLIRKFPETENIYGMTAYQLGLVCKYEGDQTGYASWLAKAAVSDLKCCVKDGLALPALAEWLYHEGELNTAFRYVNYALQDATSGNIRMRALSISSLLPMIDDAYREKINASRDELMGYFLMLTFLLVITIALVVVLIRNIRQGRRNSAKLARTAKMQESYMGNFIGLSSNYAYRFESLRKLVVRKLAAGQSDDLLKLMNSGKFSEDLNDDFYKIFDSAFLDIYPDFINGINSLLRPEEQLELKNESELTPELRIYAFVRLGVDESTRIAQILNYSVSTVYAYRNRMRNRAIDRENFDKDVMNINKDIDNA